MHFGGLKGKEFKVTDMKLKNKRTTFRRCSVA